MCSRDERRFSCASMSTQALGSPKSGVCVSLSNSEEFESLKAACWSSPGGEMRGDTGVTLRLFLCNTGDWSTGE